MTEKYLEFIVADQIFAIDAAEVKEVGVLDNHLRVPGTPEYVLGIAKKADRIVTLIDLRKKYAGLAARSESPQQEKRVGVIYLEKDGDRIGLIVDRIGSLIPIADRNEAARVITGTDIL